MALYEDDTSIKCNIGC